MGKGKNNQIEKDAFLKKGETCHFGKAITKTAYAKKPNGVRQEGRIARFSHGRVVENLEDGETLFSAKEMLPNNKCSGCFKLGKKDLFFTHKVTR